jgi:DMSO/TMAO reductase YedYZ molybdopterin-dependent catalytic subunit
LTANGYVAIKRNGVDIPYDQGGPIRLVFADNSVWAKNLDAWNWSLSSIAVK